MSLWEQQPDRRVIGRQEMQTATARNLKAELLRRSDYFDKDKQVHELCQRLEDERVRSWALHYHAEIAQSQAVLETLGADLAPAQPLSSGVVSQSNSSAVSTTPRSVLLNSTSLFTQSRNPF